MCTETSWIEYERFIEKLRCLYVCEKNFSDIFESFYVI